MSPAVEWARFGHGLIRRAEGILDDPSAVAILEVLGTGWYVQWHGEDDRSFYLEAASGAYAGGALSRAQQSALSRLGWEAPGEGWGEGDVWNWSRLFLAPVSIYEVVRLTVTTLKDVYGAHPAAITVS